MKLLEKFKTTYPESYKVFSECWLYLIQKGDIQKKKKNWLMAKKKPN